MEWKKNNDKKTAERWTLQEWLNQKDRNRLMDQWLMLHTPTPYEFFIEIESINYERTIEESTTKHKSIEGSFTAYATAVGLEFKNNNNSSEGFIDNTSLFHLRILGSADQSSHLTLSIGQKSRKYSDKSLPLRNQYLGQLDFTLYFNKHFGFSFYSRNYLPINDNPSWGNLSGSLQSFRLFIDFEALRVFGGFYSEKENQNNNSQVTNRKYNGTDMGIKFYF